MGNVKTYKFKGQTDKNGKRAIFTRVPADLYAEVERLAKQERRSVTQVAEMLIEAGLSVPWTARKSEDTNA